MFLHTRCGRPLNLEQGNLICSFCSTALDPFPLPASPYSEVVIKLNGQDSYFSFRGTRDLEDKRILLAEHPDITYWQPANQYTVVQKPDITYWEPAIQQALF